MSSITAQQTKLDLELVAKEKRLDIGKCKGRLNLGKIQREPTFQVVLDALALTPCYFAFLITADVLEVYMHQFWDFVYKHDTFYRFKMDKKKRFKLNLEIFRDIFKICPRVQGQDFDALPTDEEIVSFLRDLGHTREINSLNDVVVDQMHLCINPGELLLLLLTEVYLERQLVLTNFVSPEHKSFGVCTIRRMWTMLNYFWKISFTRLITKPTKSKRRSTQIYGVVLPESLTSPEIKETKAYKTYLGFATEATPPKKAQKFKKPASPQLTIVPVSPEEPTGKSKRVKRPAKKSTKAPARGVVIRETPEMPLSKKKEKVDVARGKGIELLSDVALTEEAQYEEVRRKSMRTFHKTHPSGSGVPDVTEEESSESEAESWGNDEDDNNNEQDLNGEDNDQENDSDDDKSQSDNENDSDFKHETNENESGSESDQDENEEEIGDEEEEVKDEFVKTLSNDSDNEDETKITDKAEGDKDEEMDYTTSQLYDDVDIRLNEPIDTDKGFIQEEEDAHVTLSTVPYKTEVPVTSSSHLSDLASKLLNFSNIPHTDAEIISPMDVHVHHEVPSQQTPKLLTVPVSVIADSSPVFFTIIPQALPSFTPQPQQSTFTPTPKNEGTNPPSTLPDFASVFQFNNRVTSLEKEVAKLKKNPLHTQVTALVDDHLDARLGVTRDEFMNFL
ncbi:hypothetical protein Tco_0315978 [Tanacetum coccineum]